MGTSRLRISSGDSHCGNTRVAVMTLRRRAPVVAAGMRYTFSPYYSQGAPQLTVAGQYEDTGQQRRQ